jgi:hypothetical protein
MPTINPTFPPGQFASKIGVVNQINFSVSPLRNKNKQNWDEKGNNFLK